MPKNSTFLPKCSKIDIFDRFDPKKDQKAWRGKVGQKIQPGEGLIQLRCGCSGRWGCLGFQGGKVTNVLCSEGAKGQTLERRA